jgi:hypothetical protein
VIVRHLSFPILTIIFLSFPRRRESAFCGQGNRDSRLRGNDG